MNRPVLVILAFLGVFLAGGISGGLVGARMAENFARRRAAEQFVQQQFKRLADRLELTQEQRQRIRPIITKAGKEILENRRRNLAIAEKMEADVRLELTDEQRARFDQERRLSRDNERLWQRWIRDFRARRQEGLGTGPAEPAPPPASP